MMDECCLVISLGFIV